MRLLRRIPGMNGITFVMQGTGTVKKSGPKQKNPNSKDMKKLFSVFAILTLFSVKMFAQQSNNLVIFSNSGDKFWVILNGVKQNSEPQTNVKVTGLIQPTYKAKVIFENKGIPDIDQTVYMMDGGNPVTMTEITYSISKTKKGYKIRYTSAAPFASVTPVPDQQTVIYTTTTPSDVTTNTTVTGNSNTTTSTGYDGGGTVTQTTTTTSTGTNSGNVGMNVGVNTNGTGFNMNVTVNDGTGMNGTTTSSTTTTTTTTNGMSSTTSSGMDGGSMNVNVNTTTTGDPNMNYGGTTTTTNTSTSSNVNGGGYSMPGYNGPYGCPYPMSPSDFEDAKKSISSKSFEDSKLTMAKQIINSNCLLSTQVKEVMLLFSFEQTRLDLAKYSYGRTYDQGNYYKLNDAFTFESSIDDLNKYIESKTHK